MKLTENEIKVLMAIAYNYYQPDNGEGIDIDGEVWSDCINDTNKRSGITGKALSGTVGSLVKKGYVDDNGLKKDNTVWLTKKGIDFVKANQS